MEEKEVVTKFKGPGQWRSQAAKLEGQDEALTAAATTDDDNLWPRSGSHHASNGRWIASHEYGFNPSQPRDKGGRWTTGGAIHSAPVASQGRQAYLAANGITDNTDYSTVTADAKFMYKVAGEFARQPIDNPDSHETYRALVAQIDKQYDYMTNTLGIKVTVTPNDPYRNIEEMIRDVEDNKHLSVLATSATGSHPFMSDAENDRFRAVHDFFGHAASGRDFNRHGERAAFLSHAKTFGDDDNAVRALFSDLQAQTAYLIRYQDFPPQKAALMPDSMVFYGL